MILKYRFQLSMNSVRHLIGINLMGDFWVKVSCIISVNRLFKLWSHYVFSFLLYYRLFYADVKDSN